MLKLNKAHKAKNKRSTPIKSGREMMSTTVTIIRYYSELNHSNKRKEKTEKV